MTNSEAIEVLKKNYPDPCFGLLREAVDVAINALSAKPDPIRFNIDHALTEEEIKNLKQKIADSPIVLMPYEKPKVIHCKDCKHHDGVRCFRWNSTIITGLDDFCSSAERRQDE